MDIYIAQLDYGYEGKTDPLLVTRELIEINAFIAGAVKSCGQGVFVTKANIALGTIEQFYPEKKEPEHDTE